MEDFARLYQSEKYGQILVMFDTNDDGDECVKLTFNPNITALKTVTSEMQVKDGTTAEEAFSVFTQERSEHIVSNIISDLQAAFNDGEQS